MNGWAFAVAAACAVAMGAAIQRGGTCTVAAVNQIIEQRRADRLVSLLEASLWVAGGLLLLRRLPIALPELPTAYALTGWTVLGAALLGFGAWVNGACVFGAIARLGSGQWAYAATPLGFYLGCLTAGPAVAAAMPRALVSGSPLWAAPGVLTLVFGLFVLWRLSSPWHRRRGARRAFDWWTPHVATVAIGITFLALLLLQGAWAYTDALAEAARGMAMGTPARLALFLGLLLGAIASGWRAGLLRWELPAWGQALRCLAGGLLMGWGSLLIPGGNDGLILLGLPLLWPHAWVAFATMVTVIAAARVPRRGRAFASN